MATVFFYYLFGEFCEPETEEIKELNANLRHCPKTVRTHTVKYKQLFICTAKRAIQEAIHPNQQSTTHPGPFVHCQVLGAPCVFLLLLFFELFFSIIRSSSSSVSPLFGAALFVLCPNGAAGLVG